MPQIQEGRIKALDGYRGVAIIIVMLRHFWGVAGAWAGVDIFFVLSGFLITTILRAERDDPNFWKVFYIRRITRILPAFLILLIATALLRDLEWHRFWFYYAFFGGNLVMIALGDVVGPLSVIWSLAVEEHFYFIWPANVRWLTDKLLTWILLGIIAAEPFIRVLSLHLLPDWHAYYFLTPFRLDGLAVGCLLSILISQPKGLARIGRGLNLSFVVAAGACFLFFGVLHHQRENDPWMFNAFGYSLIAIASGIFLAWLVLRPQSILTRIMSFGPLCFLGRISYGLYLYHSLVRDVVNAVALKYGYSHLYRVSVISFPLSIFVAWLSFEFVEKRFLALGKRLVGAYRTSAGLVRTTS
jgi:peptidoglycan/LPS O-acetylase OafA/YrhL